MTQRRQDGAAHIISGVNFRNPIRKIDFGDRFDLRGGPGFLDLTMCLGALVKPPGSRGARASSAAVKRISSAWGDERGFSRRARNRQQGSKGRLKARRRDRDRAETGRDASNGAVPRGGSPADRGGPDGPPWPPGPTLQVGSHSETSSRVLRFLRPIGSRVISSEATRVALDFFGTPIRRV